MGGRSIYVQDNPALVGGSPQAIYEQLWYEQRTRRLRVRGGLAVVAFLIGARFESFWVGVLLAVIVAGADALYWWRHHASSKMWRTGKRGDTRTARLLLLALLGRGHEILNGRLIGPERVDHLVLGRGGVTVVGNLVCSPDTEVVSHGGTLYVNGRPSEEITEPIRTAVRATSAWLRQRFDWEVPVSALLVVHGRALRHGVTQAGGVTLVRPERLPGRIRRTAAHCTARQLADLSGYAMALPPGLT